MIVHCIRCDKALNTDFLSKENLLSRKCDECLQEDLPDIFNKAIALLNEIMNNATETDNTKLNPNYIIENDLHTEIFNFLQNNNLDKYEL